MAKDETDKKEAPEKSHISHKEGQKNPLKHWWNWLLAHKMISIPFGALLVVGLLAALPFTRYPIAGLFIEQSFPVVVVDSETGKPVSSATVNLAGKTATTDNEGKASVKTSVGEAKLEVTKKYYDSSSQEVVVPILKPKDATKVELKANGRPVPVTVVNKINKKPAANVTIAAEGTEAKTDDEGKATLVFPADKKEVTVTLEGGGFNKLEAKLQVTTEEVDANTFEVTPSGKIYFLSNASGKIDVVKSNLDGTERQTVLAGTGKEEKGETQLMPSKDWKHIALLSKRDGGDHDKLFLIEAGTDKLTVMDEGQANFGMIGWSGDRFIYTVRRLNVKVWEPKRYALKSYHAPTKKITTLDETTAGGRDSTNYYSEFLETVTLFQDEVVFAKGVEGSWVGFNSFGVELDITMNTVKPDGTAKKVIYGRSAITKTTFLQPQSCYYNTCTPSSTYQTFQVRKVNPADLYYKYGNYVYQYKDGKHRDAPEVSSQAYYEFPYVSYAESPDGTKTVWSEVRDGKSAVFLGDKDGKNGKQIASLEDDFVPSGWFSEEYILLQKDGKEIHIMPASGLDDKVTAPLKVTDIYSVNYGHGY